MRGTAVLSHVPCLNHAGRKKQSFFFGASLLNAQRSPDFGQWKRIITVVKGTELDIKGISSTSVICTMYIGMVLEWA